MSRFMRDYVLYLTGILWVTAIGLPIAAQALEPVYNADFNDASFSASGWAYFASGPGYEPASVSLGLIPSSPTSPDYSNGRGLTVIALPGQGSFLYGPVIPTNGQLALIRLSVLTLAEGGTIAVGALNCDPNGSIGTVNGSVSYAYETDSGQFTGDYQYIHVLYRPQNNAIIPIFQLAVPPSAERTVVTAIFDNFEVFLLNENTVSDPALRLVLGIDTSIPGSTPTPTLPIATATPTGTPNATPTPTITPTPGPIQSGSHFSTDTLYTITSDNDQKEAFSPRVAYDRNDTYSIAAADLSGGYQDINLRMLDIKKKIVDGPFTANQTFEDTVAQTPDLEIDAAGIRHLVWSDNRSLEKLFSIYLAQVDSFGNRSVDADFEVNNLYESTDTAEPAISVLDSGDMAICWRDNRNFLQDLFVRRLRWSGGKINLIDAKDFQINIPFDNTNVSHPDIVMNENGTIVAAWSDDRVLVNGKKRNDIYARIFNKSTAYNNSRQLPDSVPEIQVSAIDSANDNANSPQIAYQGGLFVVVWRNTDPQTANSAIHAAVLNEQGTILQPEFSIETGTTTTRSMAPSIVSWESGLFFITWYDELSSQVLGRVYDCNAHLFTSDPVALASNVASTEQTSVAVGPSTRSFLVWDGVTRGFRDIFGASLTAQLDNGTASIPIQIGTSPGGLSPQSMSIHSVENSRREHSSKPPREPAEASATR